MKRINIGLWVLIFFSTLNCKNEVIKNQECEKCILEEIWNEKISSNYKSESSSHTLDSNLGGKIGTV